MTPYLMVATFGHFRAWDQFLQWGKKWIGEVNFFIDFLKSSMQEFSNDVRDDHIY